MPPRPAFSLAGFKTPAQNDDHAPACAETLATKTRCPGELLWAELMQRTFGFDVPACPRCGGRLRLIAPIQQAEVVNRILRHLGLPTDVPERLPARARPAPVNFGDGDWLEVPAFDPCSRPSFRSTE